MSVHSQIAVTAFIILSGFLPADESREQRYEGVCRRHYAQGWEKEYFEARNVLPEPTADMDKCVIYVSKWNHLLYLDSNFHSEAPRDIAELFIDDEKMMALPEERREEIQSLFMRLEGKIVFRFPTKVASQLDPLLLPSLIVYSDSIPEEEMEAYLLSYISKIRFILSDTARGVVFPGAMNVEGIHLPFQSGVVRNEGAISSLEREAEKANRVLPPLTTQRSEAAVFLTTTETGFLYIQTNYRPLLADGMRSSHGAKMAVRGEPYVHFLLEQLLFDANEHFESLEEYQASQRAFHHTLSNQIEILVTPDVFELPNVGREAFEGLRVESVDAE